MSRPFRDRGAFDRIASAYSGLTYVSERREVGGHVVDHGVPGSGRVPGGFAAISAHLSDGT
ncbi:hypothetical protein ACWEV3_41815 [Saccharopolyspora sp. NPDC003752]